MAVSGSVRTGSREVVTWFQLVVRVWGRRVEVGASSLLVLLVEEGGGKAVVGVISIPLLLVLLLWSLVMGVVIGRAEVTWCQAL